MILCLACAHSPKLYQFSMQAIRSETCIVLDYRFLGICSFVYMCCSYCYLTSTMLIIIASVSSECCIRRYRSTPIECGIGALWFSFWSMMTCLGQNLALCGGGGGEADIVPDCSNQCPDVKLGHFRMSGCDWLFKWTIEIGFGSRFSTCPPVVSSALTDVCACVCVDVVLMFICSLTLCPAVVVISF